MPDRKPTNSTNPFSFKAQFRRFLLPMQFFIVATCGIFYYQTRDLLPTLILFLCMQIFGLAGAAWSAMLARRVAMRKDKLPLANRRR
jgi:hypothetical protein